MPPPPPPPPISDVFSSNENSSLKRHLRTFSRTLLNTKYYVRLCPCAKCLVHEITKSTPGLLFSTTTDVNSKENVAVHVEDLDKRHKQFDKAEDLYAMYLGDLYGRKLNDDNSGWMEVYNLEKSGIEDGGIWIFKTVMSDST